METLDFLFDNKEVDEKQTIKNVKKFFDTKYNSLLALTNISTLKAVDYSSTKVNTSPNNSVETIRLRQLQAKEYLKAIHECINSLEPLKAQVLTYRLIEHRKVTEIMELTNYEKTRIYDSINEACCEFASILKLVTDINLISYKEQ